MSGTASTFASTTIEAFTAVQAWMNNINANMEGSNRTGFKNTRIKIGGGSTMVEDTTGPGLLLKQSAEISMTVTATAIDFHQGQVVESTSATHYAIKDRANTVGTNFFVVRELGDTAGSTGNAASASSVNYQYYVTRDGDFHWAPASSNSQPGSSASIQIPPLTTDSFQFFVMVNNYGLVAMNNASRPVVSTSTAYDGATQDWDATGVSGGTASTRPMVVNEKRPQDMTYSRYGSTIFSSTLNQNSTTFTDVSQNATPLASIRADRVNFSLEQANSSITTLIPELSLAQKTFTAIAKILTVNAGYMDTAFGLIR